MANMGVQGDSDEHTFGRTFATATLSLPPAGQPCQGQATWAGTMWQSHVESPFEIPLACNLFFSDFRGWKQGLATN